MAIDVAPGSATLGAWVIDPTPSVAAAMSGFQPLITNGLTLGASAPLLTLSKGSCMADWYIDGGNSTILNWDKFNTGSTYCGYKHAGGWQTWLTSSSSSWSSASDARLKRVLAPLEGCTEKLRDIKPCYFEYTRDTTKKRRIGLIAQEVQIHFPEAVAEGPDDKMLGLSYGDLVPALLQALQEMAVRVDALEAIVSKKG